MLGLRTQGDKRVVIRPTSPSSCYDVCSYFSSLNGAFQSMSWMPTWILNVELNVNLFIRGGINTKPTSGQFGRPVLSQASPSGNALSECPSASFGHLYKIWLVEFENIFKSTHFPFCQFSLIPFIHHIYSCPHRSIPFFSVLFSHTMHVAFTPSSSVPSSV